MNGSLTPTSILVVSDGVIHMEESPRLLMAVPCHKTHQEIRERGKKNRLRRSTPHPILAPQNTLFAKLSPTHANPAVFSIFPVKGLDKKHLQDWKLGPFKHPARKRAVWWPKGKKKKNPHGWVVANHSNLWLEFERSQISLQILFGSFFFWEEGRPSHAQKIPKKTFVYKGVAASPHTYGWSKGWS
ncbi:hypothetical protein CEXT_247481 [Caerostris extrusa]|uniref:Uncharacterized protein n=1 Tax=Caerostris extrusa TaxID=172846 RepID=A0AAV4XW78_CAEEX|nr:hypothetical protein CEXT_247481 [Caerostris extrusa]